jgi:LysR family transcriptional activator of nhaA
MKEPLNYHHLRYFWAVAREDGVGRAAAKLEVSQPSLSAQIRRLEEALGHKLFARSGRRLVLTEIGRLAYGYAEQIFGLGQEMADALEDRPVGKPLRMNVGVANVVPKRIAYRLLAPALRLSEPLYLECIEDQPEQLLADLAIHRLDVMLLDAPAPSIVRVQAFSHLLGESGLSLFGAARLVRERRRGFPRSLDGAPLLLPTPGTALRRSLEQWFDHKGLRPQVVAEFQDSALLYAFGETGLGLFPAPTVIEADICRQHRVQVVGRLSDVRERYYALTVQRRLKHPGVVAVSEAAGRTLKTRAPNR